MDKTPAAGAAKLDVAKVTEMQKRILDVEAAATKNRNHGVRV